MGETTGIGWTDETINVSAGCTQQSPACWNCYAARDIDGRWSKNPRSAYFGMSFYDGPVMFPARLRHRFRPEPHRCFINSMSDLFHADLPDAFVDDVFRMCADNPHVLFQVLTKRAERLERYVNAKGREAAIGRGRWPLENVLLGVTVEDRPRLWRLRHLERAQAYHRFVSVEPQIADLDLRGRLAGIDQVILGGESGPPQRIRPFDLAWARSARDACREQGVAFFFKQTGRLYAAERKFRDRNGAAPAEWPEDLRIQQHACALPLAAAA